MLINQDELVEFIINELKLIIAEGNIAKAMFHQETEPTVHVPASLLDMYEIIKAQELPLKEFEMKITRLNAMHEAYKNVLTKVGYVQP